MNVSDGCILSNSFILHSLLHEHVTFLLLRSRYLLCYYFVYVLTLHSLLQVGLNATLLLLYSCYLLITLFCLCIKR